MRTLLQIVLGAVERRALLHDPAVLGLAALFSRSCSADSALRTSFSALSSVSRVVSCCFHRPCCRASVCLRLLELDPRGLDRLPQLLERRLPRPASDASPLSTRVRSDFGSICRRNWPFVMRSPSLTARLTTRPDVSALMLTRPLRLNLPGRRDDRFQIARLDHFRR